MDQDTNSVEIISNESSFIPAKEKNKGIMQQPSLSFLQKAKNASLAIRKIVASGGKLVDKNTRVWRGKICENCPFWQKDGNMGLGECTKCGCTKYKRLFEAQSCPLKKW